MNKQKKFNRKLMLNKKTIADLTPKRMANVAGGGPTGQGSECCVPCNTSDPEVTFEGKTCQDYCTTIIQETCLC